MALSATGYLQGIRTKAQQVVTQLDALIVESDVNNERRFRCLMCNQKYGEKKPDFEPYRIRAMCGCYGYGEDCGNYPPGNTCYIPSKYDRPACGLKASENKCYSCQINRADVD